MRTDAEFNTLMQDVLSGSEAAAAELFRDYKDAILRVIRRRLNDRLRSKFDSTDFVQDVWASFFATSPCDRVFETPAQLVAFLIRLAENKVIDTTRHCMQAQKAGVPREQSLDDSVRFDKERLMGSDPTPSQMAVSEEEWRAFLSTQPLVYQRILVLLRAGKTEEEIARKLNIPTRAVRRARSRLLPESRR